MGGDKDSLISEEKKERKKQTPSHAKAITHLLPPADR